MVQELTANPMTTLGPIIALIFILFMCIYGIILFFISKKIKSASLKTGILIPLVVSLLGLIWWIGDNIFMNPFGMDFGGFILLFVLFLGIPLSIISIIFSIIPAIKLEQKVYPIASVVYGILYLILSLITMFNFNGM